MKHLKKWPASGVTAARWPANICRFYLADAVVEDDLPN
jgi:hypothetical protein